MKKSVLTQNKGCRLEPSCHAELVSASCCCNKAVMGAVSHDNKYGFTLLEILVAVLIIAVLVGVAVPQYQKALLKSRFGSLLPLAKTLTQGNEDYYLRKGQYADDVSKLDIKTTGNSKVQITLGNEDQHKYVLLTRDDIHNNLRTYQHKSPNFPGETHCEALIDDSQANWLCRDALKGTLVGNKYGYTVYSLSEETVGSLARVYYNDEVTISDGDKCISSVQGGCAWSIVSKGAICDGRDSGYGCAGAKVSDHGICYAGSTGCGGGASFSDYSVCVGAGSGACYWAPFKNHSSCIGLVSSGWQGGACNGSLHKYSESSACFGQVSSTCNQGQYDASSCIGNAGSTCTGAEFNSGSICYANASGACAGNTYDPTSCCAGGANCENVADRCETKNITVPPQPTVPDY